MKHIFLNIAFLTFLSSTQGAAVMSVDLGNEWMKIGVVSPGVPMEIALNKESKRKTPVVIGFRDNVRSFGDDALNVGIRFPGNTYKYLLDLLGKTIDNPIVDLYRKRFPYYNIEGDQTRNTVIFRNGDETYSVEELVAQILITAREFAEDSTGQTVTECVIIVPGFFGQSERTAMITSAQLANLKVLQLINDYTAVALNYGVFRRTEINETAQYFLFYDMGAQKTSAAVVSYQLSRDKVTKEINPIIHVLGVGYDRTLGGLEVQLRLRDYLAKEFNKLGKTKTDVLKNARAMSKLFKEAGRVKNVLSANADHFAQIENLIEDHDFKCLVTRDKLEEICTDLWPRVIKPLDQALKMSGLSINNLNQVILFGGGTRVPKVQEILRETIQQDLGKNLNADEAAAMGAVYKAADLATGFKVKKFVIKDAVIFPINIIFERDVGESGTAKQVKRTLFGPMSPYPQKKVITFNKHTHDFMFYVNYADLAHLDAQETLYIGNVNLSRIELSQVSEILEKHQTDNAESKGIKAHFILDDSGMLNLTGVEFVFETEKIEEEDNNGPLSKLGSTISKLFSSDSTNEDTTQNIEEKPLSENETKPDMDNTTQSNVTQSDHQNPTDIKNETLKIVTVKEPVSHKTIILHTVPLNADNYNQMSNRLIELDIKDKERKNRESTRNALESFVIEAQHRYNSDEYVSCATDKEIKKVLTECASVSEWLYEDGDGATAADYENRLQKLQKLTNPVYSRHWEHEERPEALKALYSMLDGATKFLDSAQNLTKETNPEKDVFTQVEIEVLQKAITETREWIEVEKLAQEKLKRNEAIRLTIKDITDKMANLDREVKYLVHKIKLWKPKKDNLKAKKEKKDDSKLENNEKTEEINDSSSKSNGEDRSTSQVEAPEDKDPVISNDDLNENPTVSTNTEFQTPHGEL